MDRNEYRRQLLIQLSPWFGLIIGVVALTLGLRAIAGGYIHNDLFAYFAGGFELLLGYVTARRAWTQTIDLVFIGGVIGVIVLSIFIITQIQLPPSVFEDISSG